MEVSKELDKLVEKYLSEDKKDVGWQICTAKDIVSDIKFLGEMCNRLKGNDYLCLDVCPDRGMYFKWFSTNSSLFEDEDKFFELLRLYEVTWAILDKIVDDKEVDNEDILILNDIHEYYGGYSLDEVVGYFLGGSSMYMDKAWDVIEETMGGE